MIKEAQERDAVIVTEDDADLREVLMEILREHGQTPIAATTLSEGERALDVRSDTVLLLDLRLGEESGLEWLHALCVKGEAPRTVIVSGSSTRNRSRTGWASASCGSRSTSMCCAAR